MLFRRVENLKPATDCKDTAIPQLYIAGFLPCIDSQKQERAIDKGIAGFFTVAPSVTTL